MMRSSASKSVVYVVCFFSVFALNTVFAETEDFSSLHLSLQYEFPEYDCKSQVVSAVVSVDTEYVAPSEPPVAFTLVLDTSGSMSTGIRIKLMKATAQFIVDELRKKGSQNLLGLVNFASEAHELERLQPMTNQTAERYKDSISSMVATGGTNLLGGILTGIRQQKNEAHGNYIRAVLILTDGEPTVGVTSPISIINHVRSALESTKDNIVIYTFGMGDQVYKFMNLLKRISDVGHGLRYIITKQSEVAGSFGVAYGGLVTTVAQDIFVTLKPIKGAVIVEVSSGGTITKKADGSYELHFTDLFLQERRDSLIRVQIPDDCKAGGKFLRVEGECVNTTDYGVDRIVPEKVEPVERKVNVSEHRPPALVVGITDIRFKIAVVLKQASAQYAAGDEHGCIKTLESVTDITTGSPYEHTDYVQRVLSDIQTILDELKGKTCSQAECLKHIDGIGEAVDKQRTGLTDEEFETPILTKTDVQKEKGEEAVKQVSKQLGLAPPEPEATFDLDVQRFVVRDQEVSGSREVDAVVTLEVLKKPSYEIPFSLTTVWDQSSSTSKDTSKILQETQKFLMDTLQAHKNESIHFGSISSSESGIKTQQLKLIKDIDGMTLEEGQDMSTVRNGTLWSQALFQGIEQQASLKSFDGSRIVFLFTDGETSDTTNILQEVKTKLKGLSRKIYIYTFGLGSKADEELLMSISEIGSGVHYTLPSANEIPAAFGDALGGIFSLFATSVTITIAPEADVEILSTFPATQATTRNLTVYLDYLYLNERRAILVWAKIPLNATSKVLYKVLIAYTDVKAYYYVESRWIVVDTMKIVSAGSEKAQSRIIDARVAKDLRTIELYTRTGNFRKSIDLLVRTQSVISANTINAIQQYISDLISDLKTIRTLTTKAFFGTRSKSEVITKIHALRRVIVTQRSSICAQADLHIDHYYDTIIKKQYRDIFSKAVVTSYKVKPQVDPISIGSNPGLEAIDTPAVITVPVEITPIDKPRTVTKHPMHLSYVVDSTEGTTKTDLLKTKSFITESIESYSNTTALNGTVVSVTVVDTKIRSVVDSVSISDITSESITQIFSELKPAGKTPFIDGMIQGIATMEQSSAQKKDCVLIPIAGPSVLQSDPVSDVGKFEKEVKTLSTPATVVPISTDPDVVEEYFGAYPDSLSSHRMQIGCDDCIESAVKEMEELSTSIAAKNVSLEVSVPEDVDFVSVDGKPVSHGGVVSIADVTYGEEVDVYLGFKVKAYDGMQPLFNVSASYYDVESGQLWESEKETVIVERVDKDTLETRQKVRKGATEVLKCVRSALMDGDYETCESIIVKQIAKISSLKSEDAIVVETKKTLEAFLQDLRGAVAGDNEVKDIQVALDVFDEKLDVHTCEDEPTVDEKDKQSSTDEEVKKKSTVPQKRFQLKASLPDKERITIVSQNIMVDLTLVVPASDGKYIDGITVFIVDTSATADKKMTIRILEPLLSQLAHRDGQRSVMILSWNDNLYTVFKSDSITIDQVSEAVTKVERIQYSGDCLYSQVIQSGFYFASSGNPNMFESVFWIVSSHASDLKDYDQFMKSAQLELRHTLASLTVFAFASGLDSSVYSALQTISKSSGGQSYTIDGSTDTVYIARKVAHLMDTTIYKNIDILIEVNDGINLTGAVMDKEKLDVTDGILKIASLQCRQSDDHAVIVKLHFDICQGAGKQELFKISGKAFNLRKKSMVDIPDLFYMPERISSKDLAQLVILERKMSTILTKAETHLIKEDILAVLDGMYECEGLVTYADLTSTYLLQKKLLTLQKIIGLLKVYDQNPSTNSLAHVAQLIRDVKTESEFPTSAQKETILRIASPSQLLYNDKEGRIHIPIVVAAPPMISSPIPVNHTITIVFDAAYYTINIHQSESVLSIQKELVATLIASLVRTDVHFVEIVFIISKDSKVQIMEPVIIGASNFHTLSVKLNEIEASGGPVGMAENLQLALETQMNFSESLQKTILLFSESSSTCCLNTGCFEDIIQKYRKKILSPFRIFTYTVGPRGPATRNNLISSFTGGAHFFLGSQIDIAPTIALSSSLISESLCRSIFLSISPTRWLNQNLSFPQWTYPVKTDDGYSVPVVDLSVNQAVQIDVGVDLKAWTGSADLFTCSVEYFRMDLQRWVREEGVMVTIYRVEEELISKRKKLDESMTKILGTIQGLVGREDFIETKKLANSTSIDLDAWYPQDDSDALRWAGGLIEIMELLTVASLNRLPTHDVVDFFAQQ